MEKDRGMGVNINILTSAINDLLMTLGAFLALQDLHIPKKAPFCVRLRQKG
ncbi:hypothetical protein ACULNC_20980 [Shigella flexneri]